MQETSSEYLHTERICCIQKYSQFLFNKLSRLNFMQYYTIFFIVI